VGGVVPLLVEHQHARLPLPLAYRRGAPHGGGVQRDRPGIILLLPPSTCCLVLTTHARTNECCQQSLVEGGGGMRSTLPLLAPWSSRFQ
jgi:hypothetical protein